MPMSRATLAAILAVSALCPTAAIAAPACPGVTLGKSATSPAEAAAVGRQISKGAMPIDARMQVGAWSIFHVKPATADALYLFFKGDPAKTERVYLSPGLGRPDEYRDIKQEVEQNVPGIPPALSSCFAHLVTGG